MSVHLQLMNFVNLHSKMHSVLISSIIKYTWGWPIMWSEYWTHELMQVISHIYFLLAFLQCALSMPVYIHSKCSSKWLYNLLLFWLTVLYFGLPEWWLFSSHCLEWYNLHYATIWVCFLYLFLSLFCSTTMLWLLFNPIHRSLDWKCKVHFWTKGLVVVLSLFYILKKWFFSHCMYFITVLSSELQRNPFLRPCFGWA